MSSDLAGAIRFAFAAPVSFSSDGALERRRPEAQSAAQADAQSDASDNSSRSTRVVAPIKGIPVPELLARIQSGDRAALGIVYTELFDGLWKFAVLHTQSSAAAMDIVQDVFFHLWLRRASLKTDIDIGVYLAVAIRNKAINRGKHHRIIERMEAAVASERIDVPGASQATLAADARVEIDEFLAAYHRAVAILSDREREAVFLRWEEGWPFERIGEVLGLSKVGARKLVLRAQRKVQELLAPYRG